MSVTSCQDTGLGDGRALPDLVGTVSQQLLVIKLNPVGRFMLDWDCPNPRAVDQGAQPVLH
jgi:hypothetical protein